MEEACPSASVANEVVDELAERGGWPIFRSAEFPVVGPSTRPGREARHLTGALVRLMRGRAGGLTWLP
jgi:hypothetical protein